ncbi:MAG: alpha-ketoacid dehydrogenase subunit beta [Candidatus Dormibacteraceae bacterium]
METVSTYANAFMLGLEEEMTLDDRIFIMGTDLFERGGNFVQVKGLGEHFGRERVRDTPISEAGMVAAGVGAAMNGMRPVVDLNFMDFVLGAMDEIVNQAAKSRYMLGIPVPLVIRASFGVTLYAAQHNNNFEAWFAHIPGLLVATPATPADTKGMIKSALRGDDPVIFLMHKGLGAVKGPVGGPDDLVPLGSSKVVRVGSHLTVVAYSAMVTTALEAAEIVAREGIDVEVIDLRTLQPLDLEPAEQSVRKTGRAIVVGEAPQFASMTSEVAASIQERAFQYLDAPVLRLGAGFAPIPHSPALFESLIPNKATLSEAIRRTVAWKM